MKRYSWGFMVAILFSCSNEAVKETEQTNSTVPVTEKQEQQEEPKSETRTPASFKPAGYTVLDSISGDLNADGTTDYILILKKKDEEKIAATSDKAPTRPMLLFLGKGNRTYELAARNDHAIYGVNYGGQMGDPYQNTSVGRGTIAIVHAGGSAWRWDNKVTFLYDKKNKDWFLDEILSSSYHATEPENVEENKKILLDFGSVRFADFNPEKMD